MQQQIIKQKDSFGIKGRFRIIGRDSKTGEIKQDTDWFDNLIMLGSNTGKDLILDRLAGTNSSTLNITACKIGTSQTAPAITDTDLGASVATQTSPTITITGNIISFQFFFADANLANGTYYEVGTFVDGTMIFNHALFASGYVKTTGTDTTVQIDFTIN